MRVIVVLTVTESIEVEVFDQEETRAAAIEQAMDEANNMFDHDWIVSNVKVIE